MSVDLTGADVFCTLMISFETIDYVHKNDDCVFLCCLD